MELSEMMKQKINSGREYRTMTLAPLETEERIVEGYATTYDEPYYLYTRDGIPVYEKVDLHAFDDADLSDVIMQYDHEGRVFARLSNNTLQLESDEHGLKVRANLGGTELGRGLYEEIKGGYTTKMSFGFTVADANIEKDPENDRYIRTIRKIGKLYDVSAVSYPQNDYTVISARSHCDGVIAEIEEEFHRAEEEQRALAQKKEHLASRLTSLMKGE